MKLINHINDLMEPVHDVERDIRIQKGIQRTPLFHDLTLNNG